jgi:DNA invertase Pin-like site-specific DNA recombinase
MTMSDKVGERHLARRAILYVRQSTAQQLARNDESRRQQYAMRERLQALGWRDVEVIDEDLGKSAAGSVDRSGFRRLVAEVSLGLVGVVAAREVSRFARNSRDWQQLIEICRVVDTLLVDHETVYAPRLSNDRLLLGLKGSLNEYELDLLRLRGLEAQREKAGRGELLVSVPVGYRVGDDGALEKTPDRRVRQLIELLFAKFYELGSARQVMLWLRAAQIQVASNRNRHGTVDWKAPTSDYVYGVLTNPTYAGAYAYGRTKQCTRIVDGQLRTTATRVRRSDWAVLLHDHHEGYISWPQFERVEEMLSTNAQHRGGRGAVRRGGALLPGLVWCGRCGHRMGVNYSGSGATISRYTCDLANGRHGAPKCVSFSALDVDVHVAQQVLAVVQPGAIEAARSASIHDAVVRDQALEALDLQAEQAHYEALRAERQYTAVDPENRTVAGELERRWNAALELAGSIEQRLAEARAPRVRAAAEPFDVHAYSALAQDLERVWTADATDITLKKRIVRAVVAQIWADVDEACREIVLTIHWKGGAHTELRVRKRRTGEHRHQTAPDVVEAVRELARILPDQQIAAWLGRAGLRTPTGAHYTRALVASVRHLRGIAACSEERRRVEGWLTCEEAAALLHVDPKTVRRAAKRNDLPAIRPLANGPWIFSRSDLCGTAVAERIVTRARERRSNQGAGPSPNQLSLDISRT